MKRVADVPYGWADEYNEQAEVGALPDPVYISRSRSGRKRRESVEKSRLAATAGFGCLHAGKG